MSQGPENPLLPPACEVRQEYRNACLVCVRRMSLSLLNEAFSACLSFVHLAEQKRIGSRLHLSDAAAVIRSSAVSKRGTWSANAISSQQHHITRSLPQFRQQQTPSPSPSDPLLPSVLFQKSSWRPNAEWFVPRLVARLTAVPSRRGRFFTIKLTFSPDVLTDQERRKDRGRQVVEEHQTTALKCPLY